MAVNYHYGKFPPEGSINWAMVIKPLEVASSELARYDGVLSAVPNAELLFSPLTTREAVLSSKIEGTQATMGEVLKFEAGETPETSLEKKNDILEVLNYRKAMRFALEQLRTMPLCTRVVRDTHRILMDSVRGANKDPGEYRRIPNWIGPQGCPVEQATFIPISADKLPEGMGLWEKYIHGEQQSRLIQLAVLHAEFEALHPFLDGNGRLGRMLVPLFLSLTGVIQKPMFYISEYFEEKRDDYYHHLRNVSAENDWTSWCRFFLEAVGVQARRNAAKAKAILDLYTDLKQTLPRHVHSQYTIDALDFIFRTPVFSGVDFAKNQSRVPEPTARRILGIMKKNDIVKEIVPGRGRRTGFFCFAKVLNIAEGYEAY